MRPEFSIIVPVYHEIDTIDRCVRFIESLAESDRAEIIVTDGGGGSTLPSIPNSTVPLRSVVTRPGRGYQIHEGCRIATGRSVLVLHVDTRLPNRALPAIREALRTHAAGAFDLSIRSSNPVVRMIGIVGRIRSRLSRVPYGDQGHFFRREVLDAIGGYPEVPLMEDVAFMDELKKRGIPIVILPLKSRTSARRWEKEGTVYTTARNWAILTAYRLGAEPETLLRWYRAHRAPEQP